MVLQIRRGTAADVASESFVPAMGEPLWLTDEDNLYIGDGATQGGNLVGGASDLDELASVTLISESIATIESYSVASNVVTIDTSTNHGYSVGLIVTISNSSVAALDGSHTILSTPIGSQFTFSLTTADVASTAATGTVTPSIPDGNILAYNATTEVWEDVAPNTNLEIVNDVTPQLGGNLDTNGNNIVSAGSNDIAFDPATGQNVVFRGNATDGSGRIVLNCEQNTHAITIQGPAHAAAANYTLTFPTTDGDADQYLITDGSGVLSWQTPTTELLYTRFQYNSITPTSTAAGSQLLGLDGTVGAWSEMTFANNATNGTNIGSADFNPTLTGIDVTDGIFSEFPVGVYRIDAAVQLTIDNLATNSYLNYNHQIQARNGPGTIISSVAQNFNFTTTGTAPGSAVTQDVNLSLVVHLENATTSLNDIRIILDQDQGTDYFCSLASVTFTKIA